MTRQRRTGRGIPFIPPLAAAVLLAKRRGGCGGLCGKQPLYF